MISIKLVIYLLFVHWFADFVCQSNYMAQGKSKSMKPLLLHIFVYSTILSILTLNPIFGLINGLFHLVTDYITSRFTSKLYSKGDVHNFFVIGLDQWLHYVVLIVSAFYLLN